MSNFIISKPGTSILFNSTWASSAVSMLHNPAVRIRPLTESAFTAGPRRGADVHAFPRRGRLMSGFPIHPNTAANGAGSNEAVRLVKDSSGLRASPSQLEGVRQFVARQKECDLCDMQVLALEGEITDYRDLVNALIETEKPIVLATKDCSRGLLLNLERTMPEEYGGILDSIGSDRFWLHELTMNAPYTGFGDNEIVGLITSQDLSLPMSRQIIDLIVHPEARKYVIISRGAIVTVSTEELKANWDFSKIPALLRADAPGQPERTILDVLMDTLREDFEATRRLMYDMFRVDIWIEPLAEGLKLPASEGGEELPRALIEAGFLGDAKGEPYDKIREFLVEYYGGDRLASIAKRHGLSERIAGSMSAKMKRRVDGAPASRTAVILNKVLGMEIDLKDIASAGEVFDINAEWPSLFEHVLENVGKMTEQNLHAIHDALLQKYERVWASTDPNAGKEAFVAVAKAFSDELREAFRACAILEELFIKIGIATNLFKNPAARYFVARRIVYSLLTQDMEEVYNEPTILHIAGKPPIKSSFMAVDSVFSKYTIEISDAREISFAQFIKASEENFRRIYYGGSNYLNEDLRIAELLNDAKEKKDREGSYNPLKIELGNRIADKLIAGSKDGEEAQNNDGIKGRVIRALSHLVDGDFDGAEMEIQAAAEAFAEGRLAP